MWLLLVAAGTGYLARCWQKARKCKSESRVFKHNAALYVSQRSPSCTPKRGRSTTAGRRGSRKRSQSAKSRKLLPARSEGRLVRNQARDGDENFGTSEKFFEELLLLGDDDFSGQCIISALKDQGTTSGQVQTSSQVSDSHGNKHMEPYLSLSSMYVQDQWRETSSCMEKPLLLTAEIDVKEPLFRICALSNKKPIFETLRGCSATTLGFVKNQLNMVASSSRNSSKPMENSLIASDLKSQALHASPPSCLQIPRIKATREIRRQNCVSESKGSRDQAFGFFAKMARELGQRTYSTFASKFSNRMGRKSRLKKPSVLHDPKEVYVCQSLSYGNIWSDIIPEKEQGVSSHSCVLHSHLLKEKGLSSQTCALHSHLLKEQGLSLHSCALHSHLLKALLDPEYLDQCHRCESIRGTDDENAVPCLMCHAGCGGTAIDRNSGCGKSKTDCQKHSNVQATGFTKPTNSSINHFLSSNGSSLVVLAVAMGVAIVVSGCKSEFEHLHKLLNKTNLMIEELKNQMDPVKPIEVDKYNERVVPSRPTMPDETAHQHAPNILPENHVHAHGLNELEAELEAELQLMELNVCNTDLVDYEWKQTQSNQESWQLEGGDDGVYVDIDVRDSMPVQDAEPLYESEFVVPPLELERRLWQVLEQRHEERICELENDLHITSEKITAKEAEVQWWKDRVWWLMETSLCGGKDNIQPLLGE